jgi:hypothetical protein
VINCYINVINIHLLFSRGQQRARGCAFNGLELRCPAEASRCPDNELLCEELDPDNEGVIMSSCEHISRNAVVVS